MKNDISEAVDSKNLSSVPVPQTDFWQWLSNNYNPFKTIAILNYLESEYNYMIGREKVSEDVLTILGAIYSLYTFQVMHPIWDKENKKVGEVQYESEFGRLARTG